MEKEEDSHQRIIAPSRPKITLPQQPSVETLFSGHMALVAGFFSSGSQGCISFSELLAGAMLSPAVTGSFFVENSNSVPQNFEENENLGLGQNGSFGFLVAQSPFFTIPSGLSPSVLLNSPAAYFHGQSPFGISHQQALAQVTAQAALSRSLADIGAEDPLPVPDPQADPHTHQPEVSKTNHLSLAPNKTSGDGYNWRKYGQKQVKGTEHSRSYYRCTYLNCTVKKKVEASLVGEITQIIYKGHHNHDLPHLNKRGNDVNSKDRLEPVLCDIPTEAPKQEPEYSQATSLQLIESSDSDDVVDGVTRGDSGGVKNAKKRGMSDRTSELGSPEKIFIGQKVVLQTRSKVELLKDGYRWRKYGQKVVKGSHYPRSYYKCTCIGCPVRKHVERASDDPESVITTYEGKHSHDVPLLGRNQTKKQAMCHPG